MNKKIKITGIAALVCGLAIVSLAGAQTSTTTTSTTTGQATTAPTSTVKMTAAEQKIAKIRNFADNMQNRFDVNIRNLDSLAQRIQNRIDDFAKSGKNISQSQAKLDEAKTRIQEAKDELAKLKQGVESMISSTAPKKAFANVRDKLVKSVTTKIKAAHKALVETIVALRKDTSITAATSTIPAVSGTSTSR